MNIEPTELPTRKLTKRQEAQAYLSLFERRFEERCGDESTTFLDYCDEHLHFVTVTFNQSHISTLKIPDPYKPWKPHLLDEFGKLKFAVMRSIFENDLGRKRELQPLGFAFVDFAGSRTARSINFRTGLFPHVHALFLTSPVDRLKFKLRFPDWFIRRHIPSIAKVQVLPYDRKENTPLELMEYCMKGYRKVRETDRDHLMMYCPNVSKFRKPTVFQNPKI